MSVELKSKKTGRISIVSDEEYAMMINKGSIDMRKFIATKLTMRKIVPSLKQEIPTELKQNKK